MSARSAFAHKGGLHVSAVEKDPKTYEHIEPTVVGNRRHIVVSDQSGRANILARFREIGLEVDPDDRKVGALVETVKLREYDGYAYDGAEASVRAAGAARPGYGTGLTSSWRASA